MTDRSEYQIKKRQGALASRLADKIVATVLTNLDAAGEEANRVRLKITEVIWNELGTLDVVSAKAAEAPGGQGARLPNQTFLEDALVEALAQECTEMDDHDSAPDCEKCTRIGEATIAAIKKWYVIVSTPAAKRGEKWAIDRPCSACGDGDTKMEHHDHIPPFRDEAPGGGCLCATKWHFDCEDRLCKCPYHMRRPAAPSERGDAKMEPVQPIERWKHDEKEPRQLHHVPDGDWVRYEDHVRVCDKLTRNWQLRWLATRAGLASQEGK